MRQCFPQPPQHNTIQRRKHIVILFFLLFTPLFSLNSRRHPDVTCYAPHTAWNYALTWLVCLCACLRVCDAASLNTRCALRRLPAVETPPCSWSQTHPVGFPAGCFDSCSLESHLDLALAGGCKSVRWWGHCRAFQVLLKLLEIRVSVIDKYADCLALILLSAFGYKVSFNDMTSLVFKLLLVACKYCQSHLCCVSFCHQSLRFCEVSVCQSGHKILLFHQDSF